ncbi:MAG: hypothetical protein LUG18_10985 [Candidatus Azobacteroides sp.]|nr:hypothetical protein [Candidatus Azobacteroides sp.]
MGKTVRTILIAAEVSLLLYGFFKQKPWQRSKASLAKSTLSTLATVMLLKKK